MTHYETKRCEAFNNISDLKHYFSGVLKIFCVGVPCQYGKLKPVSNSYWSPRAAASKHRLQNRVCLAAMLFLQMMFLNSYWRKLKPERGSERRRRPARWKGKKQLLRPCWSRPHRLWSQMIHGRKYVPGVSWRPLFFLFILLSIMFSLMTSNFWLFQARERFLKEPAFEDVTLESERKRIFKDFMHILEVRARWTHQSSRWPCLTSSSFF